MNTRGLKVLLTCCLLLLVLFPSPSFATGFTDVKDSDPLAKDIEVLKTGGFISGYPDGSFHPEGTITRAEFVRIANGIFGYKGTSNVSNLFGDINENAWYYNDVMIAQQAGYVLGYPDGSFRPEATITKEEVAAIFDRILSLDLTVSEEQEAAITIADDVSPWARKSVLRVVAKGLMAVDENGCFGAKTNSNRGHVVYASARSIDKMQAEEIAPLSMVGGGAVVGGEVTDYDLRVQRTIDSVTKIIDDNVRPSAKLKNGDIVAEKAFLVALRTNMQNYLNDKQHFDADLEFGKTRVAFLALPTADQEELKRVIPANVDVIDLSKLRSFFGF